MSERTKEWIESLIEYEEHAGFHTYHTCQYCNKNATRAGKCSECLREDLRCQK